MKNLFRQELEREITKRFTLLSLVISGLLIFILFGFIWHLQSFQLSSETQTIQSELNELITNGNKVTISLNQGLVPDFIKGESSERELYGDFYAVMADEGIRGDLIVMTVDSEIIFSTSSPSQTPLFLTNYLQTVVIANNFPESIKRITVDYNGDHYLVLFQKVTVAGKAMGYSILLINGNDFLPENIRYGTQFIIGDQFDNYFTKSSTQFINEQTRKIEVSTIKSPFFLNDNNIYLSNHTVLGDGMTLYSYSVFLPLSVILMFTLLYVGTISSILVYQSRRIAIQIADHNTKNIDRLIVETNKISNQEKAFIDLKTGDEFEFLADKINEMVSQLTNLHQDKMTLEKQSVNFERKMLEAQFNPHFLYNTLETIRVSVQFDPKTAEKLIMSLNKILRYSVDQSEKVTTLFDDIDIIKEYLVINKIRFEQLNFSVAFDQALGEMVVPRLFLLPVIENALKYGMRVRSDLKIKIDVYVDDLNQEIIFEVADNGPGFDEKQIEHIYRQYERLSTQHGLINSFRRFKLKFSYSDLRIINQTEGVKIQFVIYNKEEVGKNV